MATRRERGSSRGHESHEEEASESGGEDFLSALPDELLHRVLSFLPAHEAVRTCKLSRGWRNIWRSAPVLRIRDAQRWANVDRFNKFVKNLLLLRDPVPLEELKTFLFWPSILKNAPCAHKVIKYADPWIRHALMCNVRVLRVLIQSEIGPLLKINMPLVAARLRTLQLRYIELNNRALDFSSCPALEDLEMNDCSSCTAPEDLEMNNCTISSNKILSMSLKRLCITERNSTDFTDDLSSLPALEHLEMKSCIIFAEKMVSQSLKHLFVTQCSFDLHTNISAPDLISLRLGDNYGWTPLLESMPLLVTASVKLGTWSWGCCSYRRFQPGTCVRCDGDSDGSVKCVLLRCLFNAANLELAAEAGMCIFKQDLTWCPTFSKLKTLLLDGWVVGHDFHALVSFLQHTPILEKLILQLCKGHEHMVEIEESSSSVGQLVQFEHLCKVEVRCLRNDEWVHKISKILNTYGIAPDKISINFQDSVSEDQISVG